MLEKTHLKILYVLISFGLNLKSSSAQGETVAIRDPNKIGCGPDKNSPIVELRRNVKAKPPFFVNISNIELLIPVQELTFLCNATYPIEWVFAAPLGPEWNIQEGRGWNKISPKTSIPIYTSEMSYKPSPTAKPADLTCRSVGDKACLQTTVTVRKNNLGGNQTLGIKITRDHPKGIIISQYSSPEGTNVDCSITLEFVEKDRTFRCYSETEKNLTLNLAENVAESNCYDPFSCGIFFTENKNKCMKKKTIYNERIETAELFSPLDGLATPGVVVCKPAEGRPPSVSAAMQYFYSLPQICPEDSTDLPHIYTDILSVRKYEFLSICQLKESLYRKDIRLFSCISSLYYFADGIQIKVKRKNKRDTLVAPNPAVKMTLDKSSGYRNYTVEVKLTDSSIYSIECSAPVRKSDEWFAQEIHLTVLDPTEITFDSGQTQTKVQYVKDTVIRCQARGNPKPYLSWSQNDRMLTKDLKVRENQTMGWTEILFPNENISAFYGAYSCRADNRIEFKVKVFILEEADIETSYWYIWWMILPLVIILVSVLIGFLVWKIIEQTKKLRLLTQNELDEFMNGRPDVLNSQRSSSEYDVNSYAACLPYNKNYEVLKEQLEIDTNAVLGSGAYGMVLRGILSLRNGEKIKVAIKTVKPMDDISYFKALMSELKIMGTVGKHDNIVNLLAACTKQLQSREIYIAIEYCDNGNLLNYLRDHRYGFANYVNGGELKPNIERVSYATPSQIMNTLTLLRWGLQIANGMDFLYHKKVIHGDLAARNILLAQNLIAKIGDFGLSRQLFEYANYIKKHQSPLPWKWLALECLQDMKFSSKSDVWAYGVTLWEIFSLGQVPYPGMSYNEEFMDNLIEGKRPAKPQYATKEIYNFMHSCWSTDPSERPTFLRIKQFFDQMIRSIIPQEYVELEDNIIRKLDENQAQGHLVVSTTSNSAGPSSVGYDNAHVKLVNNTMDGHIAVFGKG